MTLKTLSAGAATALALAALASGAQATVYNLALTGVVAHGTASFYSSPYKFEIFTLDLGLGGAQPFTLQVGDEVRATVTLDTPLVVPQSGLDVVWTKLTNTDGIDAPVDATTGLTGIGDLSGGTLGAGTGPLSGGCGNCLSNFILEHNGFSFDTFFSDVTVSALAAPYEVNNIQLAFEANDPANFPTSVPEPATWGLMLAGFAGLGAVMRRRRVLDQARGHGRLAGID